jgi:membrane-associated protease RseP (regulator of RpoE activity)
MVKYRVEVEEVGIGIPFERIPYIQAVFQRLKIVIGILPVLVGAYVQPSNRGNFRLQRLPYSAQAEIYAAGPWANLVFGLFVLIFAVYVRLDLSTRSVVSFTFLLLVFWYLGQRVFSILSPIVSVFSLSLMVYGIFLTPGGIAGPIGTAEFLGSVKGIYQTLMYLFAVNVALSLFNLLPLSFLDGGKIWRLIILRYTPKLVRTYDTIGTFALLAMFGAAVIGDLISLLF